MKTIRSLPRPIRSRVFTAAVLAWAMLTPVPAEVIYFLVAEQYQRRGDSFVLPLTHATDIAEARAQLQPNARKRSPGVRVAVGGDGINRNLVAPVPRRWSWHVTGFGTFFDSIGGLAGSPTLLESDVERWIDYFHGEVGFLGYVVTRELTLEEVFSVWIERGDEGVDLRWADLGSNYVYSVELNDSLDPAGWRLAPGTWPAATNCWTTLISSDFRIYRVQAAPRP